MLFNIYYILLTRFVTQVHLIYRTIQAKPNGLFFKVYIDPNCGSNPFYQPSNS